MANAPVKEPSERVVSQRENGDQDRAVQRRLSRQSRRRLSRLGPLGWFLFDFSIATFAAILGFVFTPASLAVEQHVTAIHFAVAYGFFIAIVAHIAGLHDPRFPRETESTYVKVLAVIAIATSMTLLELTIVHYLKVGRYIVMIAAFSCGWVMLAARIAAAHFATNFMQTVALLGDDQFCFRSSQFIDSHDQQFNVLSRQFESGERSVTEWAIDGGIDELVFDSASLDEGRDEQLLDCLDEGVKVSSYSDFVEDHYFQVPVEQIDASWVFSARLDLAHPYYQGLKRGFDFFAAIAGLILTSPIILVAIVLIRLESSGSAIYYQDRTGRFGRTFRIFKLRTMVQNAESDGAQWASSGDTRITRLGRILRKTRIDELPQFWNVLRGDMSLVGPRPERPEFVELLQHEIPFYLQRHLVKPGLTGWAQINYPYGASVEDSRNKLAYDLFYIKRASLALDLQILLRTVGTMMKGSR